MKHKKKNPQEINIERTRQEKYEGIRHLHAFRQHYSRQMFMEDLRNYFGEEVDFNLERISEKISSPEYFQHLIAKAAESNTHPVTEFIKELFEELGKSGSEQWPQELERGEFLPDE